MREEKGFDENKAKEEGAIKVGAIVTSSRGKHKRIVYSQEEARLRTVKDVIEQMVEAVKTNQTLNLNNAKNKAAKKYGVDGTVRLTEIISAVPEEHKKSLLPQLRAKPVRTASGGRWSR